MCSILVIMYPVWVIKHVIPGMCDVVTGTWGLVEGIVEGAKGTRRHFVDPRQCGWHLP